MSSGCRRSALAAILRPRDIVQDRAVRPVIAVAGMDQLMQGGAHRLQFAHLLLDCRHMRRGDLAHVVAGAAAVLVERHQLAAVVDGKTEIARAAQESQPVDVVAAIVAVAVAGARLTDQADLLIVANGLGRQAGTLGGISIHDGFLDFRRLGGPPH